ncbi:BQ5605_C023g09737 [Microbotryum silenes-dioicae]|uniref:BQ5605_C023g09737 protein n=1 Tax=Microbotryum silenes-dioicae TaxID=796604 RepID=A0A2X0NE45_9BASI|nr:BQ5605_C023g09737 [Microbotryum silenes-dioicae]
MCTARGVVCTWAPGTGPSRTSEEADLAACEAEVTRLSKLNAQLTLRIQQLEEEVVNAIRRERTWADWREGYNRERGFVQQSPGARNFPSRPTSPQSMRSYQPSGPTYPRTGVSARRRSISPPRHSSRQPSVPPATTSPRQLSHSQGSPQNRVYYRSEPDTKPNLAQYERPAASGFVSPRVPRMNYRGDRTAGPDTISRHQEASNLSTPRKEGAEPDEREHSPVSSSLEKAAHLSLAALRNHHPGAESAGVTLPRLQMDAPPSSSRAYLGPSNSSSESSNARSYGLQRQGSDPWQYRVSPSSLPQWAKHQASASSRSNPPTIETSAERERTQSYPQSVTSSTSPRSSHFESVANSSSRSRTSSGPSTCATSTDKMDAESDQPEEEPDPSILARLDRAPSA